MIKISKKEWDRMRSFEKDYIIQRAETDGLWWCKEVIREARKQIPGLVKLFGFGKAEDKEGNVYVYSGSDTRKFRKLISDPVTIK